MKNEINNLQELKTYLVSLGVGIKDVEYIDNERGEYIILTMDNEYKYEPINVTGDSKYAMMFDIVSFMRKHF